MMTIKMEMKMKTTEGMIDIEIQDLEKAEMYPLKIRIKTFLISKWYVKIMLISVHF